MGKVGRPLKKKKNLSLKYSTWRFELMVGPCHDWWLVARLSLQRLRVQSRLSPREIWGGWSNTGTGLSQYLSSCVKMKFVHQWLHVILAIHSLSKWHLNLRQNMSKCYKMKEFNPVRGFRTWKVDWINAGERMGEYKWAFLVMTVK
jgi:hypothetical protein